MIGEPEDAIEAMRELIGNLDREAFAVLNLSSKGQVLNASICTVGTVNAAWCLRRKHSVPRYCPGQPVSLRCITIPADSASHQRRISRLQNGWFPPGTYWVSLLDHIILGKNQEYPLQKICHRFSKEPTGPWDSPGNGRTVGIL